VRFSSALIQPVLAVAWGLTFGGYAFVLWPLSYFNHKLFWEADAGQLPAAPQIRITTAAVRRLAVRIMVLAVLGYVAWALFRATLAALGRPASTSPWWIVTALMEWSHWFVLGTFVWLSAPVLAFGAGLAADSGKGSTQTYAELIGVVGFAVFAFPILTFPATLLVMAIKVSLVHSWATEGTVFWASYYYRNVFVMYAPWFLVGGGMIALRRLIGGRW
jgi:hypothetical protein